MKNKRKIIIAAAVVLVLAVIVGACAIYLGDYYRADIEAIGAFLPQGSGWAEQPDGTIVFERDDATKGFIFYPGGKVEAYSYLPLLMECSRNGIFCAMPEMPFRLAVFDIHAAEEIRETYPDIDRWYIGGHSLGGSMAALYAQAHAAELDGLILLGSYASCDLSGTDLRVLSVYGSEDGVMNREKYERYKNNLPASLTEVEIAGCNCEGNVKFKFMFKSKPEA